MRRFLVIRGTPKLVIGVANETPRLHLRLLSDRYSCRFCDGRWCYLSQMRRLLVTPRCLKIRSICRKCNDSSPYPSLNRQLYLSFLRRFVMLSVANAMVIGNSWRLKSDLSVANATTLLHIRRLIDSYICRFCDSLSCYPSLKRQLYLSFLRRFLSKAMV